MSLQEQALDGSNDYKADFDLSITSDVIGATGPGATARAAKVLASLTRHLHDFARENGITRPEFDAALGFLTRAGQMTSENRDEMLLLSNILGGESIIDDVARVKANDNATVNTVLGPFWREHAPHRKMGDGIAFGIENADHALMRGTITDAKTGEPIVGAELDIWETAPNGMYEQQDPDQVDWNLHGIFTTGSDGKYHFYGLRPTTYSIPDDGPAGDLLKLLDRHTMRPAHIHVILEAPGYRRVVTELFDRRDKHVHDDAVLAVRGPLIVDFKPLEGDPRAKYEMVYDFRMARLG